METILLPAGMVLVPFTIQRMYGCVVQIGLGSVWKKGHSVVLSVAKTGDGRQALARLGLCPNTI